MEHIKYPSIENINRVTDRLALLGQIIHVSEKIDGANASIGIDKDGVVHFYSRNSKLSEEDGLRGFVQWSKENINLNKLLAGYRYFGEWVVKHKIKYIDSIQNTFVLYDIFDEVNKTWCDRNTVELMAKELNVTIPTTLYVGEYKGIEHLKQFVGETTIADGVKGEGIVIRTNNLITKWVREDFQESKPIRQPKEQNLLAVSLVDAFCTEARIDKAIHKGLDEGIYSSLDRTEFGKIMKFLTSYVLEDVFKEESDNIPSEHMEDFIKLAKKRIPNIAQKILLEVK